MAQKEADDRRKGAITLYLDKQIIARLRELASTTDDPRLEDRSASWLVNDILREKTGMPPEGQEHE